MMNYCLSASKAGLTAAPPPRKHNPPLFFHPDYFCVCFCDSPPSGLFYPAAICFFSRPGCFFLAALLSSKALIESLSALILRNPAWIPGIRFDLPPADGTGVMMQTLDAGAKHLPPPRRRRRFVFAYAKEKLAWREDVSSRCCGRSCAAAAAAA